MSRGPDRSDKFRGRIGKSGLVYMKEINRVKALKLVTDILRLDALMLIDNGDYQDFIRLRDKVKDNKPILDIDIKSLERIRDLLAK